MPLATYPSHQSMAVLYDLENILGFTLKMGANLDLTPLILHLEKIGEIGIQRALADLGATPAAVNMWQLRKMLQSHHITHETVPHLAQQKNSADIALACEAMHIACTRDDIKIIVVVANDRDFIPLFLRLRALNKIVIGVGPTRSLVNPLYASACSSFIYMDEIGALTYPDQNAVTENAQLKDSESDELQQLLLAIRSMVEDGKTPRAAALGNRLRQIFPDFHYGPQDSTFKAFCLRMAATGRVVVRQDAHDFLVTEVDAPTNPVLVVPPVVPASNTLVESYRAWILKKFKISMPQPAQRQAIYSTLIACLDDPDFQAPLSLKSLSQWIGALIPEADQAVFRVLYGLSRSNALVCKQTENVFDPFVLGLNVAAEQLDFHFVVNTLAQFRREAKNLPFDPDAWSEVFHGDVSAANAIRHVAQLSASETV